MVHGAQLVSQKCAKTGLSCQGIKGPVLNGKGCRIDLAVAARAGIRFLADRLLWGDQISEKLQIVQLLDRINQAPVHPIAALLRHHYIVALYKENDLGDGISENVEERSQIVLQVWLFAVQKVVKLHIHGGQVILQASRKMQAFLDLQVKQAELVSLPE